LKLIFVFFVCSPYFAAHITVHNHQLRDFAFVVADGACHRFQHTPGAILGLDAVVRLLSNARFPRFSRRLENPEAIVGMDLSNEDVSPSSVGA